MTTLADILAAYRVQAAEAAAQGFSELRQGNQSVKLPDPLNMARAIRILREEDTLGEDREIFHSVNQDVVE